MEISKTAGFIKRIAKMFDFDALKRSLQAFKDRRAAIADEIAQHTARRNTLKSGRATKAEIKAMLELWVDDMAAGFAAGLRTNLDEFIRNPERMQGPLRVNQVMSLAPANSIFAAGQNPQQCDRAICGVLGPQVKQALLAAVDSMEWEGGGLPMTQRAAEIQSIDAKLEELYAEDQLLVDQATAAGISLVEGHWK